MNPEKNHHQNTHISPETVKMNASKTVRTSVSSNDKPDNSAVCPSDNPAADRTDGIVLAIFCVGLVLCVVLNLSVIIALAAGLLLFAWNAVRKGFPLKETMRMAGEGALTSKNVLITLLLVGILTGVWRSCGAIAYMITALSGLIRPSVFVPLAFLANCAVSVLTGTSFGTVATMGTVCMTMGNALGVDPALCGGAILSGIFFGDRCSPVSSSALLTTELTKTDIFTNIKLMVRSALFPFLITLVFYAVAGFSSSSSVAVGFVDNSAASIGDLFAQEFVLAWPCLIPACTILLLAVFRVSTKINIGVSILAGVLLDFFLQRKGLGGIVHSMFLGFVPKTEGVAALLSGGGFVSMVKTLVIVTISSSYSVIFDKTGMLQGIRGMIAAISRKITAFGGLIVCSLFSSAVACNQTLAAILCRDICKDEYPDNQQFAIDLEDTVIVISPLIPWCIAGAIPVATLGAPAGCRLLAVYLWVLPLWGLGRNLLQLARRKKIE